MEDLLYLDNRVLPCDRPSLDGRQRRRIQYRFHASEIERRAVFLRQLEKVLKAVSQNHLSDRQNNSVAYVCGTCRIGTDPKSGARPTKTGAEVDHLYVVDAPFFPSSTGLNPGLTVAANALRVAAPERGVNWANGLAFRPDSRNGRPAAR